ncbi:MAG: AAA family ATPase, partial [Acetobacteraceae bacterium]
MRLASLALTNYGVFRSTRIEFDTTPGRINLLIAPNGAGKSILRGAFCDLLFGIGGQTPMGFRYGYPNMRLMADAMTPSGVVAFGRRKGTKSTLIDGAGEAMDPAAAAALLGTADRALLERLFALDTERLRLGGQALLASGGELADALLSAAGGLREARAARVGLEAGRDALAPKHRTQNRPFYVTLDAWLDARRRVAASTLKPETRQKQELELTSLRNEQTRQSGLQKLAMRRLARLERVRRVRVALAALDAQEAWLASHPDAPVLPPDAGAGLDAVERKVREAEQAIEHANATRGGIAAQCADVSVDDILIEAAAEMEALVRRGGAMEKAASDRPARQAEHDGAVGRVDAILRQLGARRGHAIPPLPAISRARQLLSRHDTLRADLDRLPREAAARAAELAKTADGLAALAPPGDMRALNRLVREIGTDPASPAREAARAVTQRRAVLEQTLRRVPGWISGAEALADLRPLPLSEYERLGARTSDAEQARAQLATDLAKPRACADDAITRLGVLSDDGPIPDEGAVRSARHTRDAGWVLICRRLFGNAPDQEAERAWAGGLPLGLAYERAVAAADGLADRRGSEAQRIEQAAELRRQIAAADGAIEEITARLAEAEEACARARVAWAGALPPGLADDVGLPALRDLLTGRERVMDALRDLSVAEEAHTALLEQHAEWVARLVIILSDDPAGLPALLARAEDAIDRAARTEKMRTRLETGRATASQDAERLSQALAEAIGRQASWQAEWADAIAALGRPADEHPDVTRVLLDAMTDLDKEQQSVTQLGQRLHDMETDVEAFRADVAGAARRLAPDLADADAFEIVRVLRRRLTEQQKGAQKRDTLRTQIDDYDRKLGALAVDLGRHRLAYAAALETVGAETMATARERVALATERTRAEAAHREAER